MINKQYIYILDYCSSGIYEIETTTEELDEYSSVSDFLLEKYDIHEDYISFMVVSDKINKIEHIPHNNK